MKQPSSIVLLITSALLSACLFLPLENETASDAVMSDKPVATSTPVSQINMTEDRIAVQDEAGTVVVQKVPFRTGVSSVSVERLAKRSGCSSSTGAGLVTEEGPIEVYRMQCNNGATFLAQCELRQCRPMR